MPTITPAELRTIMARHQTPPKPRAARGTGAVSQRKRRFVGLLNDVAAGPGFLCVTAPIRTVTESNANEYPWSRAERAKRQRNAVGLMLRPPLPPLPAVVTLTRHGPRRLDKDNHVSSHKHVRDAVADLYGVNDGLNSPLQFEYGEQVLAKECAVSIEIRTVKP